uniref:Uncharacterized protein n=1 Tax=Candidatus Kentrum sp. TC TaxID=2126339 RepID=A0A450ZNX6_9GAMM|nr:MAG: hypothetical protein BECKTC1821F_GA0114240_100726 [Candidatus Kentron sp. TC]
METWLRHYLKEEYFMLQNQYEDYDRRALHIKGWIGAGAIAGIAIGFDSEKPNIIWILISILSGCFWWLEAKWRVFQRSNDARIRSIEAYFRGEDEILIKDLKPLQIYHCWYKSYVDDNPIYEYEKKYRPKSITSRIIKECHTRFCHATLPVNNFDMPRTPDS